MYQFDYNKACCSANDFEFKKICKNTMPLLMQKLVHGLLEKYCNNYKIIRLWS